MDRYGNDIGTQDPEIVALYNAAMDATLAGDGDMRALFQTLAEAAPDLPFAHSGLARTLQIWADMPGARAAAARAKELAPDGSRAALHATVMEYVLSGRGPEAYRLIRAHVEAHPRDAMLAQMCTSIFGMIGFSGMPGREAELLGYTQSLLPHYGEDWWMLSQHAFSLCETGQTDRADAMIDRSLALRPDHSHAVHVRSHVWYEAGETQLGLDFLQNWRDATTRDNLLYGHLSWHIALWALGEGDIDTMWQLVDESVGPEHPAGPPINVVTDTASILYRAELAGVDVDPARWAAISDYAAQMFPETGVGFIDVHAALAHAMAGDGAAALKIAETVKGANTKITRPFAQAYEAIGRQDWTAALGLLTKGLAEDERMGGSRAQRDLIEFTYAGVLLRLGRGDEAARVLAMRRPIQAANAPIAGLNAHRLH